MSRFWKIAGITTLVAVLGVVAVGAVAFAQDDEGAPFNFHEKFREAIAGVLNISVEEYDAAVEQARDQVLDEALEGGVVTEEQAERMRERVDKGFGAGPWDRGFDRGFKGRHGGFMGHPWGSSLSLAAEELGMTEAELLEALQDGKSIADLAGEKGVSTDSIVGAYMTQLEERLNQAVEDEKIDESRAETMLERAKEMLETFLNETWEGRFPGGFPDGGRPGRMKGFPGQTDA